MSGGGGNGGGSGRQEGRLEKRLAALRAVNRPGLACFLAAGDPNPPASARLLDALVEGGADIVELGMPFSDPMADGPAIQAASRRALAAGTTLEGVLELAAGFRRRHGEHPLVLMGYCNPILKAGAEGFCRRAAEAGADALIIVDLPPEEEDELRTRRRRRRACVGIRLLAPTSGPERRALLLEGAEAMVYYVAVRGITGTRQAEAGALRAALARLRAETPLAVAAGFGLREAGDLAALQGGADVAVVGSALVELIAESVNANGGGAGANGGARPSGLEGAALEELAGRMTAKVRALKAGLMEGRELQPREAAGPREARRPSA